MKLTRIARSLAVASVLAFGAVAGTTIAQTGASLTAEATNRYFVHFGEAGALHYQGGVPGLARTAAPGGEFDARTDGVVAYRDYLETQRLQYIGALEGTLGRSLEVTYHYDIFFNGIVIENLTGAEAALVAAQPNVSKVEVVKNYELSTDRVEAFIGAGAVWSGDATPNGTGSRGEGAVIAIIDTGLNAQFATHGSFQNDASCGHTAAAPKVIAAKDCVGSSSCTGANPADSGHPHGSHVSSTAGGNNHIAAGGELNGTRISGVAPCARLISYKGCPGTTCDGAALSAAFQTIMVDRPIHGITAVNYSISGGNSPWSDADRSFLDMVDAGIFVAASAGNTSDSVPNPIGNVNHRGPWVATVANSTHDRISSNPVSVAGGPQNVPAIKSEAVFTANRTGAIADAGAMGNIEGCTASGGFAAGSMTGRIALIRRGTCTFEEKGNNAIAAGAVGMIVFNNNAGPAIVMGGTAAHSIPSVMISLANGQAIQAYVGGNPTAVATMNAATVIAIDPAAADVLSAGSLRGPMPTTLEVTKPDITGPGTNIFAAYNNTATAYGMMSGTSMSGPHIAGAGALIRTVHPTWTPPEVKSALMMTAKKEGMKDFTNGTPNNGPWDADDVGNGRLDLTKAALAGLVMHETTANFLAANGSVNNQRALNLPSMRNTSCTPSCTFTRTVRNTIGTATSWTATGASTNPSLSISVSPASFSFPAGNTAATQTLTITVTPTANLTAAMAFGEVVLSEAGASPDLHMTVAIRGQGTGGAPAISVNPTSISGTGTAGSSTPVVRPLAISNTGGVPLTWNQGTLVVNTRGTPTVVWDQPESGTQGIVSSFSTSLNSGAYTAADFTLAADTDLTQIKVYGFDSTNTLPSQSTIRWAIYPDAAGSPAGNPETNAAAAVWAYSSAPNGAGVTIEPTGIITLNLTAAGQSLDLAPGTYWLTVLPTYPGDIQPAGSARWNWFQSEQVGAPGKLIAPGGLFGGAASTWSEIGALTAGALLDTAFTLTGVQGAAECGAPWLSINPTSGTVAPGGTGNVSVQLNASALAAGTYTANLCIESNDPANPEVIVPVSFEVSTGGGAGEADLALNLSAIPTVVENGGSATLFGVAANFGPDEATGVTLEVELPEGLGYVGSRTQAGEHLFDFGGQVLVGKADAVERGTSTWTCAEDAQIVTCSLSGSIANAGMSPVVAIDVSVATAGPGVVTVAGVVTGNEDDANDGNNADTVDIEVTGLSDIIFQDGFEGEAVKAPRNCININASTSNDAFASGDPNNWFRVINIGAGNTVTAIELAATIEAFAPSWLSEARIGLAADGAAAPVANIGIGTNEPGVSNASGAVPLTTAVVVGANGLLRVERNETFDDESINPDSEWRTWNESTMECAGLHLICTDQQACDEGVAALGN